MTTSALRQIYTIGAQTAAAKKLIGTRVAWAGSLSNMKIGVVVRSPFADRYKHTANKAAVAADSAAAKKLRRYGLEVWTLKFETRSRPGSDVIAVVLLPVTGVAEPWVLFVLGRVLPGFASV